MLNMDFSQTVTIDTTRVDWTPSPMSGVFRKKLAREEAEQGHATSIVRYDAGASFSTHDHPRGEEILVLQGVFSDETGDYPAGTYFRNPKGFRHAPFSVPGCEILVKLHQFQAADTRHVCIDTNEGLWQAHHPGCSTMLLHQFESEQVRLVKLTAEASYSSNVPESAAGEEIYIVDGSIASGQHQYFSGSWLRNYSTALQSLSWHSPEGALLWVKTGHL